MRFLFFGDKHERLTPPENRIGNYYEDIKAKTEEILRLGEEYGVSAYLQPGDFFHTPNPPLDFVAQVIHQFTKVDLFSLIKKLTSHEITFEEAKKILSAHVPIIGVAGNHELFGGNLKTLDKTVVGFLNSLGIIHFATKENPYYFYTEDGLKIAITGTHYHLNIDTEGYESDYVVEEKLGDYHIHIVHGMLSDKYMGKYIRHTLIKDIVHTKADLTLVGHNHIGFPLTEIDGKYFANPGAIPRLTNDLKEIDRTVKVLLIEITKKDGLKVTEIPLRSAKPGHLVLDRTKIQNAKEKALRFAEYEKEVKQAGVKKTIDVKDIVLDIADNKKLPQEVKDDVVKRITAKMREWDVSETPAEEVYIEKIILENFQSHEYTEIDCHKGLNVFIGESRNGKSAVIRALSWVYENKPTGRKIIRHGANHAAVTVVLSNGYVITRFIDGKKNGYRITNTKTMEVSEGNTKLLPLVQKILGYTTLRIDDDMNFSLNFLKQGTGWFLIGEDFSAPQRAKIIGGIYGTQFLDSVKRDIDTEEKRVKEKLAEAEKRLEKLDAEIASYNYLDDLALRIKRAEELIEEVARLNALKEEIKAKLALKKKHKEGLAQAEEVLSRLSELAKAEALVLKIKEVQRDKVQIIAALQKKKQLQDLIRQEDMVIQQTKQLAKAEELLKDIRDLRGQKKEISIKLERVKQLENTILAKNKALQAIEETLAKTQNVKTAEKLLQDIKGLLERRSALEVAIQKYKNLTANIKKEEELIKQAEADLKQKARQYEEVLLQAGQCPICHGTIDKAIVRRIVHEYVR